MLRTGAEFPPSEYGVLGEPSRVVEIKSVVCEWDGERAVLAFARDVTERKAIERRLVESDRLAALGTLAAGVAHEINNPLTFAQLGAKHVLRLIETTALPGATLGRCRSVVTTSRSRPRPTMRSRSSRRARSTSSSATS